MCVFLLLGVEVGAEQKEPPLDPGAPIWSVVFVLAGVTLVFLVIAIIVRKRKK